MCKAKIFFNENWEKFLIWHINDLHNFSEKNIVAFDIFQICDKKNKKISLLGVILRACKPSLSVTSATLIAFDRSCLFAKIKANFS